MPNEHLYVAYRNIPVEDNPFKNCLSHLRIIQTYTQIQDRMQKSFGESYSSPYVPLDLVHHADELL